MIDIKVHFGNNNTIGFKAQDNIGAAPFAMTVVEILNKSERDIVYVLVDGNVITDWTKNLKDYTRAGSHHAYFILKPTATRRFEDPVPVFIANPRDYFTETSERQGDCCDYCTLELTDGTVELRACHHAFHEQCITEWLAASVKCPFCNGDVRNLA